MGTQLDGLWLTPDNDIMATSAQLQGIDAVTITVPDLDAGEAFYTGVLGLPRKWRNDEIGQAGLALPKGNTELVLVTELPSEPNWLVESVDAATEVFRLNGGAVISEPENIPVGRLSVVRDPFGNRLVLLDLSQGHYVTNAAGQVTRICKNPVGPTSEEVAK